VNQAPGAVPGKGLLPEGDAFTNLLRRRNIRAGRWSRLFLATNVIAIATLVLLFLSILNQVAGYAIVTYEVPPQTLSDRPLETLNEEELIAILERVGAVRLRVLIRDNFIGRNVDPVRLLGESLQDLLPEMTLNRRIRDQRYAALTSRDRASLLSDLTGKELSADQVETLNLGELLTTDAVPSDLSGKRLAELADAEVTELLSSLSGSQIMPSALTGAPLSDLMRGIALPPELAGAHFGDLTVGQMATVLRDSLSATQIADIITRDITRPRYPVTWTLTDSIFNRDRIEARWKNDYPDGELVFRNWLTWRFVSSELSSEPAATGLRTALFGSLWVIVLTILVALPIGIGAAIYLEEYAGRSRLNDLIETNIRNLAGVPSIIYGMLGLAVFVRALGEITSGAFIGQPDANGRTVLSAALTMALLILPVVIINAQEAIRAVPSSIREASFGVGATKWQTVSRQVLPAAFPGILTGLILSVSRAVGETAPLIVVGGLTFMTVDPNGPFSRFSVVPIQIYSWTSQPEDVYRNLAAAAIIVLLITLLSLNAVAIILRQRFSKKLRG
jgi:phosphate transport system permease protein